MAAINKGKSCLDVLAASGFVWGAVEAEAGASRVVGDEAGVDALSVVPLSLLSLR